MKMAAIKKFLIVSFMVILSLSVSQSALAGQTSQIPSKIYTTSDGRVMQREFIKRVVGNFVGVRLPHRTIVICADEHDIFLGGIREFNDYLLADMGFRVLDGRKEHEDLDEDTTTYVYFGILEAYEKSVLEDCLKKYPKLHNFVTNKQQNDPHFEVLSDPNDQKDTLSQKYRVNRISFTDQQSSNNFNVYFGFCFDKWYPLSQARSCLRPMLFNLFSLQSNFCDEKNNCLLNSEEFQVHDTFQDIVKSDFPREIVEYFKGVQINGWMQTVYPKQNNLEKPPSLKEAIQNDNKNMFSFIYFRRQDCDDAKNTNCYVAVANIDSDQKLSFIGFFDTKEILPVISYGIGRNEQYQYVAEECAVVFDNYCLFNFK